MHYRSFEKQFVSEASKYSCTLPNLLFPGIYFTGIIQTFKKVMNAKVLIAKLFTKDKIKGWLKKLRYICSEHCYMAIKIVVMPGQILSSATK